MDSKIKKIINPANFLTFTRFILIPVFVWAFATKSNWVGVFLITYSGFIDGIDGKVARYFDCSTTFGEFFDAISDAFLFLAAFTAAAIYGYANPLHVAIFLILGVINALGRVIFVKKTGRVTNFRSYASEILGAVSFWTIAALYLDFYIKPLMLVLITMSFMIVVHDYYRILTYPPLEKKNV
ncbi:MAG: CDP-alcohol phosphatidyltransferase family protein [Deltaproteobacteria bacterium]|nr:CDP-alcohol phosphatidyltransferase family protein [Deltaproteobacteria bacterium]